jgi:hypothetical protein
VVAVAETAAVTRAFAEATVDRPIFAEAAVQQPVTESQPPIAASIEASRIEAPDVELPRLDLPPPPASAAPGVVLPLTRTVRIEVPARTVPARAASGVDRLLRIAAARGATALFLTSESRPWMRLDGDLRLPRFGGAAVACRRRKRDPGNLAGERPGIDRPRRRRGVDRRVRERRPRPLHDVHRPSRSGRLTAADRHQGGDRGTTRPRAGSPGTGDRIAGAGARHRPARRRQVDAALGAR